jgi:hypothetical protein
MTPPWGRIGESRCSANVGCDDSEDPNVLGCQFSLKTRRCYTFAVNANVGRPLGNWTRCRGCLCDCYRGRTDIARIRSSECTDDDATDDSQSDDGK